MSTINIRRDNKDPFYRYKMPSIISKVEGRGNGIKTAVVNTSDVARALSRTPAYMIKFFGFELGAQTSVNDTDERYIVNGAHDAGKLQDLLDVFISKFVLCDACKNPETDFIISKDGRLLRDCKACGQRTQIDPTHKLTSFILKHPPVAVKGKKKAATASASVGGGGNTTGLGDINTETTGDGASDIPASSGNGDSNTGAGDSRDGQDAGDGSDDELTRRIKAEASALPSMDTLKLDDDNWTVDVSEEAVRARQKDLEKGISLLKVGPGFTDEDPQDKSNYEVLGEWVLKAKPADVEIFRKAQELGIVQKRRTIQVLAQSLFTDDIVNEIAEHKGLLNKLITLEEHEKSFLGGIERFVGLEHPDLISKIPNILYALYDQELVSEDVVAKWGSSKSRKYVDLEISKKVRKAAKPFLEWLEEQSEDEDEDDED